MNDRERGPISCCKIAPPGDVSSGKALAPENSDQAASSQDLFGETPEAPRPVGRLLSPGLVHSAHGDKEAALLLTNPGMAGIAEPALGKTCRECLHWGEAAGAPVRDHWGDLRPQPCRKYCGLMRVPPKRAPKLAHDNCTCRHFELNKWAPEIEGRRR